MPCCRYDAELNATLAAARQMATVDDAKDVIGDVLLMYDSQDHYENLTGRLGMLREWKVRSGSSLHQGCSWQHVIPILPPADLQCGGPAAGFHQGATSL